MAGEKIKGNTPTAPEKNDKPGKTDKPEEKKDKDDGAQTEEEALRDAINMYCFSTLQKIHNSAKQRRAQMKEDDPS